MWQIDVICGWRIFSTEILQAPVNMPYEMGKIGGWGIDMTTGQGYDLCQTIIYFGVLVMFVGAITSIVSLWLWDD